jgi:hypothetical protein
MNYLFKMRLFLSDLMTIQLLTSCPAKLYDVLVDGSMILTNHGFIDLQKIGLVSRVLPK